MKGQSMGPAIGVMLEDWADPDVALPSYETAGAAGADLRANLPLADRAAGIVLAPGARALLPSGFRMEIPSGWEVQVRPRSGLALKHGVTVLNGPGTIDSDYRGPVGVLLINLGSKPFVVNHGDRIAQLVVAPVAQARMERVETLGATERGDGGFGSTGRA